MYKTVYLSGPIAGQSFGDATDWRIEVHRMLSPQIDTLSPMRGKDYLDVEATIDPDKTGSGAYDGFPLSTQRGIFTRDYNDVVESDAVLVNLQGSKQVSIGTMFEIAWGWEHRKPIVLIQDDDGVHDHPFVREASSFIVASLDDAVYILRNVLLTDKSLLSRMIYSHARRVDDTPY